LTDGDIPNVWLTSADGQQQFYLMGGLAPFPGVTDGIICVEEPSGWAPKFKHLDIQAARQDGVTYQGTVYDPAIIKMKLQVHARTAPVLSQIMNQWMGAWNPRNQLTLERITPDGGYWSGKVRLMPDSWQDPFKLTPRQQGVWSMTHICRIDDAFWNGITTTGGWAPTFIDFGDDFSTPTQSGLGPNWQTSYSPQNTGFEFVGQDGEVHWSDRRNNSQSVMNIYTKQQTTTDYQVVSITLGGSWSGVALRGDATTLIGARMDLAGNGVFCRITWDFIEFYAIHGGGTTVLYTKLLDFPPRPGETWQLICGANPGAPRTYTVTRSGMPIFNFTEIGTNSLIGANNRYAGFGMTSTEGVFLEGKPIPIANFTVGHNTSVTQSGYVQVINQGTEVAWPEFQFYGPGTWSFGNGAGSTSMITFPALNYGQLVSLVTLPRYQEVIDLTSGTPVHSSALQGKVSGVYNNPIPGVATPDLAELVQIPVTLTGGSAASKIVASVTPRRVHPA
jgi:hypothetical protein